MIDPSQIGSSSNESEPGKRMLLGMLGVFAALTVFVVSISLAARVWRFDERRMSAPRASEPSRARSEEMDPRLAAFLGPLATERRFERWRITRIDPLQFGRMTFEIESESAERLVVDVHASSDKSPPPVAKTAKLAFYVRTNQRGGSTPASLVDACEALARQFEAREAAGHEPPPLEALVPR